MRLRLRLARASFRTLAWSAFLVSVGVWALLRTALGHQVILNWLVDQVDGRVAGRISVEALRSGGIFRGARLVGVQLRTPQGETFLTADSLEVSYSLRGLIAGELAFRGIRVWGADMDLAWREGVEGSTLDRWRAPLRSSPETEDAKGGGPTVRLEDIRLEDTSFRLRIPTRVDPAGLVRVLPDGGGTLALDLFLEEAQVPEFVVAPNQAGGTSIEVFSARGRLDILRDPIPIREFSADVRVADGRLNGTVNRLAIPQATLQGAVTVFLTRGSGRILDLDLALNDVRGEELARLVPATPPFTGRARLAGVVERGAGGRWTLSGIQAGWEGARIQGGGGFTTRGGVRLDGLELRAEDLPVAAVARYVPVVEGKPGTLSGNVRLSGPLERLGVVGRAGHRSADGDLSTADVTGILVREESGIRFSETEIFFNPLQYRSLEPWVPGLPVAGSGTALIRLNGSPLQGLRMDLDLTHSGSLGGESRVVAQGSVRLDEPGWRVDVQGDAAPFHLAALKDRRPDLPVQGAVAGSFRVSGRTDSLALRVEVEGEEGRLAVQGTLDPLDLTRLVRVEGTAEDFRLGAFLPPAGDRTLLNGEVRGFAVGRGAYRKGEAYLRFSESNILGVPVDSVLVRSSVRDGALVLDTARASLGGFEVDGGGSLGLPDAEGLRGTMTLAFRSDSLMGLRPAFLGDVVHARDTLQALDREILLLSGIDPDTLPLLSQVTLQGSVEGRVELAGALDDFQGTASMVMSRLGYGDTWLEGAVLELQGRNLPGDAAVIQVALDTDSLHAVDRDLARSRIRASMTRTGARATAYLVRNDTEEYTLAGGVTQDGGSYRVDLDQADFRFDSLTYSLSAPARLTFSDSVVAVDALDLVRSGPEEVRISARGILPQRGDADFNARITGVRLERLTRLLQMEERELEGRVDMDLSVRGPAAEPEIQGELLGSDLRAGRLDADSTRIVLDYSGRKARVQVEAWQGGAEVVRGGGTVPVDLTLRRGVDRTLEDPMDVRVQVSQLEVAPLLSLVENLEDVQGRVSGEFTVRGTLDNPIPEGLLELSDGGWTVGALGVRQGDVSGTFTLSPDGSVAVDAQATAGGRVDVTGSLRLSSLTNPDLDLELRFRGFQAVERRDVAGAISGTLSLDGSYSRPQITGTLTVDEGTLFLEEFQRAVGVVDLTDPLFLGLVERETLALQVDRPLLAGVRNPFLDSLRVQVDMNVPRNTWLRSGDMNVEIGGDLDMTYDRPRRDLVLVGELLARRGQYNVLGRTFEVEGGTVSFIGLPGINPILNIQAVAPVRRQEGGTLDIQASVQGSLVDPSVSLSTEEAGLAQSDLVSYLIFGRPSSDITAATNGTSSQLTTTAGATLASAGLGTLASQLGSLAAQGTSYIDYLSVSQVGDLGLAGGGGVASSFSGTQVEVGWYFGGGDLFGVLVLRPLSGLGGTSTSVIGGARVEWQASEQYHVEAFVEDQFLRRGAFGLSELRVGQAFSLGLAFFREWGY